MGYHLLLKAAVVCSLLALGRCAAADGGSDLSDRQETESVAKWLHSLLPTSWVGRNPYFCKWYACPAFNVIDRTWFFETRSYGEVNWVTCALPYKNISTRGFERETRACFWALYNYISGDNAASKKIKMTVPVVERFGKDIVPFMGFFIPGNAADVPAPNNANLTVVTQPPTSYYVRSFTGFGYNTATGVDNWRIQTDVLKYTLKRQGKSYGNTITAAGYDSPWSLLFRHNEIWIEVPAGNN